jgi:hypothetical protein
LKNLRANYDIKYYLDDLYEFQASVDVIKTTTEDEMLDMLQWEDVMDMAANIDNQWIAMQTQHFDGALFEFDNTKLWKYRTAMQTVTEKVKLLNEAMNNADRIKVANASGRLDLAVLEVLRMFGDFETADTYYAQRHFNNNELISLRN